VQPDNLVKLDTVFTLGTSAGVQDSAEFGIWWALSWTPASSAAWDAALAELAQYSADQWSTLVANTLFSNAAGLLHCRAARCNTTGHTVNEQIKTPATPWTGTPSAHSLPWATTLAVSLYAYEPGTFTSNARNKRGRIYLPPLNTDTMSDTKSGEIALASAQSLRDQVKAWLSAIATHDLASSMDRAEPGVLSTQRKLEPGYPGLFSPISWLAVDTKLDTQRRRERQQLATRSSVAFP
jgi:hypothetical protein